VDVIDEAVQRDARIFFGELGDVGIACCSGGTGVTQQMLDMA